MTQNRLILCLLVSLVITGCDKCKKSDRIADYDRKSGLVFIPKPGVTPDSVKRYIAGKQGIFGRNLVDSIEFCVPCDSSLFTIKGLQLDDFLVQGQTQGSDVKKPTPPDPGSTGEWGPFYYSAGYIANVPEPDSAKRLGVLTDSITPIRNGSKKVLIAVLDTGVDSLLAAQYAPASIQNCISGGSFGWNFYNSTSNTNDNFGQLITPPSTYTGHGTPASRFVLQQLHSNTSVDILPVKVLNESGQCNLFQLMCGLAYAKRAGAKIINLSLGFYAPTEAQAQLFKTFMDGIAKDSVIVIAAAGNANHMEDSAAVARGEVSQADLRNLDKHLFFPAAFSKDNPNIITVTTVSRTGPTPQKVAAGQNFSTSRVQIGVVADTNDAFLDPYGYPRSWEGSSFATPVATGLIASAYYTTPGLFTTGKLNRNALFTALVNTTVQGKKLVQESVVDTLPKYIVTNKLKYRVANPIIIQRTNNIQGKP